MNNPNITMEEYIKLKEEKARRHGRVYNWETATYGKIWYDDDDVHDLIYMETEFPAIVFDDTFMSQVALSCEPTSLEGNVMNIDTQGSNKLLETSHDRISKIFNVKGFNMILNDNIMAWNYLNNEMLLNLIKNLYVPFGISFDPNRFYKDAVYAMKLRRLRFEGLEYTDTDIADFEKRLGKIYGREGCSGTGLHTAEEMDTTGFGLYWTESARQILNKGDLSAYWRGISSKGDFLRFVHFYTAIGDPMLRLCHRLITCSIDGRSQAPEKVTVTDLFYLKRIDVGSVNTPYLLARLLTEQRLPGLTMIVQDLPMIDMAELVRLQICKELDDTWGWVAPGPKRQHDAAAGFLEVAKSAHDVDEDVQAVSAPVQAPQPPLAAGPTRTMAQRIARLEEDIYGMEGTLGEQKEVLDSMALDFS
ncbi:hypothetical protein Tco_1145463 [Tanacetum coccineum]